LAPLRGVPLHHHVKNGMRAVVRVALFTTEQRAVNPLLGGGGETARTIDRQWWLRRAVYWFPHGRGRSDELLQFREKGLAAVAVLDFAEIADVVKHAIGERLFI